MHWGRDRVRGRLPLERTIEMLTREPARYLGLTDRGTIEVGAKADLNVIDLDRLALCKPRVAFDLPAGGRRLLQDARGFRATIVSGTPRSLDDRPTGAMPGRLVRMGASPA
jgi:N-acyl-D-aspartate/D-glutamate deacylase